MSAPIPNFLKVLIVIYLFGSPRQEEGGKKGREERDREKEQKGKREKKWREGGEEGRGFAFSGLFPSACTFEAVSG